MKEELQCDSILVLPHPFDIFEIQRYYQNEPNFNDFIQEIYYLIKDGACLIYLDDYKSLRIHWIHTYAKNDAGKYFDSLRVLKKSKSLWIIKL